MAEPTFENAIAAMKAAKESGDMDAARRMARLAQSLRAQESQPSGIGNNSPVGQFNRAVADALEAVNPLRAVNAIAGTDFNTDAAGTLRGLGVATATEDPETMGESFGRGAGNAAAMFAPAVGILGRLRTAGGALGAAADDALAALLTKGGAAAEVTAGGVANMAGDATEDAGYPQLRPYAEIGAGALGLPAAVAGTQAAVRGAGRVAANTPLAGTGIRVAGDVKRALVPMTETGAREVARDRLRDLAGGEDRANELAQMINPRDDFNRTPGQQTEDPNLLGLERAAADENPLVRERLDARLEGTRGAVEAETANLGGNVGDARAYFRSLIDDAISGANQDVSRVGPQRTEAENSVQLVGRLKTALENARMREDEAWARVPEDVTVSTEGAKAVAQEVLASTGRARQQDIPQVVRHLLLDEGGFADAESALEVRDLYSELRRQARSAMAGNDQNANRARIANAVADALQEAIDGAIGPEIVNARNISRELHETFDRGAVGRILQRTLDGDETMTTEAALDRTIGRGGNTAMADEAGLRRANVMTGENVQDYLRSRYSEAIFNASGEFTPKQARTWLRNNKETLNQFPSLRAELTRALQGREAAQALSIRADLKDFNSGQADKAVQAILGADNPVAAAKSITATARGDQTGKGLAGVKGAFTDYLTQDIDKLPAVLSNPKFQAAISEVFDAGELRRLRQIAQAMRSTKAKPSDVGGVIDSPANRIVEYAVRIIAAQRGGAMGGGSMGGSLQTASIASSFAQETLRRLTNQKARELLMDAVEDPALMRELLMKPETWAQNVGRAGQSRLTPYLTGTAAQVGDEE